MPGPVPKSTRGILSGQDRLRGLRCSGIAPGTAQSLGKCEAVTDPFVSAEQRRVREQGAQQVHGFGAAVHGRQHLAAQPRQHSVISGRRLGRADRVTSVLVAAVVQGAQRRSHAESRPGGASGWRRLRVQYALRTVTVIPAQGQVDAPQPQSQPGPVAELGCGQRQMPRWAPCQHRGQRAGRRQYGDRQRRKVAAMDEPQRHAPDPGYHEPAGR